MTNLAEDTGTSSSEWTPFGRVETSQDRPVRARLYGWDLGAESLFLGRSRTPTARTDLFVDYEPGEIDGRRHDTVKVSQILLLSDQSTEMSTLEWFNVWDTDTSKVGLFHGTKLLYQSDSMADLFAVALLNAAG